MTIHDSNEYLLAEVGVDTAHSEPSKVVSFNSIQAIQFHIDIPPRRSRLDVCVVVASDFSRKRLCLLDFQGSEENSHETRSENRHSIPSYIR